MVAVAQLRSSRLWLLVLSAALLVVAWQLLQTREDPAPSRRSWTCAYLLLSAIACTALATKLRRPLISSLDYWRRLWVGLILIYAGTVTAAGGSGAATDIFAVTTASWLWISAALALREAHSSIGHPLARALELLATNAALFLVVGEALIRLYALLSGQALLVQSNIDAYRLKPHLRGRLHTNSLGYPSREFVRQRQPGVQRIAVIGDSCAVGVVEQQRNFASQIEVLRPGMEVYNFGVSAIGPPEYYQLLISEVLDYQPDFVLLSFFVGNDIGDWSLQQPQSLSVEASSLYLFLYRSYRILREEHRRGQEGRSPIPWRRQANTPPMRLSRATYLQVELERMRLSCPALEAQYQASWRSTLRYLKRINMACRGAGVPLGIVMIPDEYQVNAALLNELLEFGRLGASDVELDLVQRQLRSFFTDQDIPYLDLLPSLRGVPDTYVPQDSHWNDRGNRIAAEKIVEWLDHQLPRLSGGKTEAAQ